MTIQSLAWALEQTLPAKPKLVLIALADCANGNGCCFFEPHSIAKVASTSIGGLWAYLAALERNELVSKTVRKTKHGEKRDYWLAFTRDPGKPWTSGVDETAEPQDNDAGDDLRSPEYQEFLRNNAA